MANIDNNGALALSLAAAMCGVPSDPGDLEHRYTGGQVFGVPEMLRAARSLNLRARVSRPSIASLAGATFPAIAREAATGAFFIIARASADSAGAPDKFLIQKPGGPPSVMTVDELRAAWDGSLIRIGRRLSLIDPAQPFGMAWFYAAIFRYRRLLTEVLVVSLALQLLSLATPLFFQVVVDKVLVHRGLSTLDVVAVGLGLALCFEVLLSGLRSYVFSHTTNRIDVELGAKLFHHLLRLPMGYFNARRVGDSVARVRELENIRQFLTGSTLTSVLDLLFGSIFLAVIFLYSPVLGWVVAAGIPIYFAISFMATPALKRRVQEKFQRGAANQAFLVETVSGIETVKALAVEAHVQRRWEEQLSSYVRAAFRMTTLGILASQSAQLVSRATTLAVLYVGATLVMREKMTIGELVAVNMLAGQIAGPVLRLAQVWQDFQQARVSVDRVGDILNSAPEPVPSAGAAGRPPIRGDVQFDAVTFRYHLDTPPVLNELSLQVPAGQILGVVGPSGSGKSTLTKLLQRLHAPEKGRVLLDGLDLAVIDPVWLRRQVGVVLQESLLFNASIRDNIALTDPALPMSHVVKAARVAGAHEFITELPGGYETIVGERGASLSGGQRQRIAIARALIAEPKVLILDEATSALDLESEQAIQDNMRAIAHGRTVIIVAHRLSALRLAHRIVTVERGQVVEDGTHAELIGAGGRYARLWAAQTQSWEPNTAQEGAGS